MTGQGGPNNRNGGNNRRNRGKRGEGRNRGEKRKRFSGNKEGNQRSSIGQQSFCNPSFNPGRIPGLMEVVPERPIDPGFANNNNDQFNPERGFNGPDSGFVSQVFDGSDRAFHGFNGPDRGFISQERGFDDQGNVDFSNGSLQRTDYFNNKPHFNHQDHHHAMQSIDCFPCGVKFPSQEALSRHLTTDSHKQKILANNDGGYNRDFESDNGRSNNVGENDAAIVYGDEGRSNFGHPHPNMETDASSYMIYEHEPPFNDDLVILDWYNSDLNLEIDTLTFCSARPLSKNGFGLMWAGVRSTYGINRGRVCYEVRVDSNNPIDHLENEPEPHILRCGWSINEASLQLGEEGFSYGYGGTAKISVGCSFKNYGSRFGVGDVIGCYLDLTCDPLCISYTLNGVSMGAAFYVKQSALAGRALFPHILTKNQSFTVNFGQLPSPMKNLIPEYSPIGQLEIAQGLVRGSCAPKSRSDCEVIMMIGLPGAGKTFFAEDYKLNRPEKKYNILGTNALIDRMKVMGLSRKHNYTGRWDALIQQCTECFQVLLKIASKRRRNYILDQTNVFPTARRRKLTNFVGFQRKCFVVVPTKSEYSRRVHERERKEGKDVPEDAILNMKANFVLPDVCETYFDEVIFTELDPRESSKLVEEYNREAWSCGIKMSTTVQDFVYKTLAYREKNGIMDVIGRSLNDVRYNEDMLTSSSSSRPVPPPPSSSRLSLERRRNTPPSSLISRTPKDPSSEDDIQIVEETSSRRLKQGSRNTPTRTSRRDDRRYDSYYDRYSGYEDEYRKQRSYEDRRSPSMEYRRRIEEEEDSRRQIYRRMDRERLMERGMDRQMERGMDRQMERRMDRQMDLRSRMTVEEERIIREGRNDPRLSRREYHRNDEYSPTDYPRSDYQNENRKRPHPNDVEVGDSLGVGEYSRLYGKSSETRGGPSTAPTVAKMVPPPPSIQISDPIRSSERTGSYEVQPPVMSSYKNTRTPCPPPPPSMNRTISNVAPPPPPPSCSSAAPPPPGSASAAASAPRSSSSDSTPDYKSLLKYLQYYKKQMDPKDDRR